MKGSNSECKNIIFIVWLVELGFVRRDHSVEDAWVCMHLDLIYNSIFITRNLGTTELKAYLHHRTQHPTAHGYKGREHSEQECHAPPGPFHC